MLKAKGNMYTYNYYIENGGTNINQGMIKGQRRKCVRPRLTMRFKVCTIFHREWIHKSNKSTKMWVLL